MTQLAGHDVSAPGQWDGVSLEDQPYDQRRLSYASTFTNPVQQAIIQAMELLTAKPKLLQLIRRFETAGVPHGQAFWAQALHIMGIDVQTPADEIAKIPPHGPLVVTANHPHGLVDGMVLADLIGRVRTDYKILTRSLLTGLVEIDQFMLPVPFAHDPDALPKNVEMRRQAMAHLAQGGAIALFPAGVVASADNWFGPAVERDWNAFTAKMIRRSNARVLPIRFPGQNSRAYQIANCLSPTLRQGLLLYEVRHALNKPQRPFIGAPLSPSDLAAWADDPMGLMRWLRAQTLDLG
ncbi:lysophospholipid acyltransferase family protein [Meridianimarinicoccus aquatilis]|uniref:Acyltransferase n=1 Tax=Meridianimarinicoccus aquatilis TaxID=2552766 RepID=A0A4R6B5I0_9RHOB|nr:lysophospholipid acyltransferase family protein [Fluviibacterium aquatile]TDL90803.1 acyltransferase [Fluviibacterium aquatile]